MNNLKIVIIFASIFVFTACSSTSDKQRFSGQSNQGYWISGSQSEGFSPPAQALLQAGIAALSDGNFALAQGRFNELLNTYKSKDGSLETHVHTALAIAALKNGDNQSFQYHQQELVKHSQYLLQLPKQTQLALKIGRDIENVSLSADVSAYLSSKE